VHHSIFGCELVAQGQSRSSGDVGSMSGLAKSGHTWTTYESKDGAPTGKRTVNTEPLPASLVTVTSPPIIRASLRVMARPRSVPLKRCAVGLFKPWPSVLTPRSTVSATREPLY
jgi:hypothetical protein